MPLRCRFDQVQLARLMCSLRQPPAKQLVAWPYPVSVENVGLRVSAISLILPSLKYFST
jgi:hypothetical protein